MACVRESSVEGRIGIVQCDEEGCKLRRVTTKQSTGVVGGPSTADCVLQLRLRAREAEDFIRGEFADIGEEWRKFWESCGGGINELEENYQKFWDLHGGDEARERYFSLCRGVSSVEIEQPVVEQPEQLLIDYYADFIRKGREALGDRGNQPAIFLDRVGTEDVVKICERLGIPYVYYT